MRTRTRGKERKKKRGTRKKGGATEKSTMDFLNLMKWDEAKTAIMMEQFLTLPNWDEQKVTMYPMVNFDSDVVYTLIEDKVDFLDMANAVCDTDLSVADLHNTYTNLKTNASLRHQLAKHILSTDNCSQDYVWKRLKAEPLESLFVDVDNLHVINVYLKQYAIENFQGQGGKNLTELNRAIANLHALEKSLNDGTFLGDVNAKVLEYLTTLIKNLPIRKWSMKNKKYCHTLAWDGCNEDPACKQKTDFLGRRQCVSRYKTKQSTAADEPWDY